MIELRQFSIFFNIVAAILKNITFRKLDSLRFLICYNRHPVLPQSVKKPFVAIFLGSNHIFSRLYIKCLLIQAIFSHLLVGEGIYDIWYPYPKKIATKGFSTDLSSIGFQYEHIKNLKKSNFRKVLFSRWPPNH